MNYYKIVMLVTILLLVSVTPRELVKFTLSSYILPDKSLSMELSVATPRNPGSYPVMLFMTGLEGVIPAVFYEKLIESVAEQGFIWMTVSKLRSPNPEKITNSLKIAIDWLNENIQQVFNNKAPGVIVDIQERLILLGHSSAGHAVTQYLNSTCGTVKLLILMSPVDGVDPFGIKKDYIITPGKFLPFATPTLLMATELDDKPRKLEPPCAPTNLSNTRFYNAMSGPKWYLNVSKYGHADFLDASSRDIASLACATCSKNCDFAQYRTYAKEVILSFADAILYKDALALSYIEDAKFLIPSLHYHDHMGYDPLKGPFCKRVSTTLKNLQGTFLSISEK